MESSSRGIQIGRRKRPLMVNLSPTKFGILTPSSPQQNILASHALKLPTTTASQCKPHTNSVQEGTQRDIGRAIPDSPSSETSNRPSPPILGPHCRPRPAPGRTKFWCMHHTNPASEGAEQRYLCATSNSPSSVTPNGLSVDFV